ncbi:hydrogenase maturation protease [Spirulina sp. CS-785/01]|uniref:hydrogenase maturation protease n=1 Tax=Spirulina sp. CS-785/01 TaxID=3021716 RepID=UPI00232D3285|nr:hydrogenase maturation protease [Spirulina sp. CS-785/01]MDB9313423.1 hydrogenase maturation protease [Spirulina sp. CS-785/01]
MRNYLVIGYGNTLRSDDGAGQAVAERVDRWQTPEVDSLSVHQLTPELADTIAQSQTVIFVDVQRSEENTSLQCYAIEPNPSKTSLAHSTSPQALLSLTQHLYNATPNAYWLLIPAVNFDFGETFSPTTQQGIQEAVETIKQLTINN